MPPGRKPQLSSQQIQEILNLRNQKLSLAEIKKQLNLKLTIPKIKNSIRYYITKTQIPPSSDIDNSPKQKETINGPIVEKKNQQRR